MGLDDDGGGVGGGGSVAFHRSWRLVMSHNDDGGLLYWRGKINRCISEVSHNYNSTVSGVGWEELLVH